MTEVTLLKQEQIIPGDKFNARTREAGDIDALAKNIKTVGLLQPLLVRPEKDKYRIIAGNRRFAAIKKLNGGFAGDVPVLVREVDNQAAMALSLTENDQRLPMHPIERMEAFAKMAAEGASVEGIAVTFGTTLQAVRRALKLGQLIKPIRDQLAETLADRVPFRSVYLVCQLSEKKQRELWKKHDGDLQTINHVLREDKIGIGPHDARRGIISVEEYQAAGGTLDGDLFTDDHEQRWLDADIADKLVEDWIDAATKQAATDGWSFVERVTDHGWYENYQRLYPEMDESLAPKATVAKAAKLEAWLDKDGNRDNDDYESVRDEWSDLEQQIRRACEVYSPEQKATGGLVIDKNFEVHEVERRAGKEPAAELTLDEQQEQDATISNALRTDLHSMAGEAVQRVVGHSLPMIGTAMLALTLLEQVENRWAERLTDVSAEKFRPYSEQLHMSKEMTDLMKPYFRAKRIDSKLKHLINLSHEDMLMLLAYLSAYFLSSGSPTSSIWHYLKANHEAVFSQAMPVMSNENYYSRLSKKQILAIAAQNDVTLDANNKKKELAKALEEALPQNWLPPELV